MLIVGALMASAQGRSSSSKTMERRMVRVRRGCGPVSISYCQISKMTGMISGRRDVFFEM